MSPAVASASRAEVGACASEVVRAHVLPSLWMSARVENGAAEAHVGVADASDAALARRASGGGDRAAEAELCKRFAPRIRLYGLKHLRTEEGARDLVQAVLASVIEALRAGRVEDCERIDRFMLGTARNVSLKIRHQDGRATPTAPHEMPDLEAVLPPIETVGDIESLLRCIKKLELRAQTVLQLSFYRDKSADEIAGVLSTSAGNVRVVRHRALAQLRDCLAARGIA